MKLVKVDLKIKELYSHMNINLKLRNNLNILIGENGCGKSTLLKIINCFVNNDYLSLYKIPFKNVRFKIFNNTVKLSHKDLEVNPKIYSCYFRFMIRELDINQFKNFDEFYDYVNNVWTPQENSMKINENEENCINDCMKLLLDDQLVFGFDNYLEFMTNDNYQYVYGSKIYFQLLYSYLANKAIASVNNSWIAKHISFINIDPLFYDFSGIDEDIQNQILIELKKFINTKHFSILDNKLIVYLSNKEDILDVNFLSSGEKKLIQILKCIFNLKKNEILLLDEPELSLSFIWHERLMKLLVQKSNNNLIIVATHTPFIKEEKDLSYLVPITSSDKIISKQLKIKKNIFDKKRNINLLKSFETFTNKILDKHINKNLGSVVVEYLAQSHFSPMFIFVEGVTDIDFYKAVYLDKHSSFKIIPCSGKENVIASLNYLMKQKLLDNKKHIHIIDRDYFPVNKKKVNYSDFVYVTKYYSVENYIFTDINLKTVLLSYGLTDEQIKDVFIKLKKFVNEILDFECLRFINHINFQHKINDLKDGINLNKGYTLQEDFIKKVNYMIDNFGVFEKYEFEKVKEHLSENWLFMNGHDLALFLDLYVAKNYNPNVNIDNILSNKKLVKNLEVELLKLNELNN